MQISCGIRTEIQEEGALRDVEEGDRRDISRVMPPRWTGFDRRVRDAGSHPHAVNDSAEVQRFAHGRVFEGEVGDSDLQGIPAGEEELYGPTLLGTRLLREYGRVGRASDQGIYQGSGTGRKAPGADEISRTLTVAPSGGFHHTTRYAGGS